MKSKQVREFIDGHIRMRLLTFTSADIEYCAMLAEKEAEERIREKAIGAFCASNCPKGCSFGADGNIGCRAKAIFIQKLNEE